MNKQQTRRVIQTIRYDFPRDPEKRLENILNIINTEPKIITIGFCLEDSVPKTPWDLQKNFLGLAKGRWSPGSESFRAYCKRIFVPMGVAEELIVCEGQKNPVSAWQLTEEGYKYARPIAAFTLKYLVDNDISMYKLLGSTHSKGGRRAPYNRYLILDNLRNGEPKRQIDIAININSDPACVRRHLEKLENLGLVSYDSVGAESSGWAIYSWIDGRNPEDVKIVEYKKSLDIANHLKRLGKSECNKLAKLVNYAPPSVSNILRELERQGFVKPDRWSGGYIQSEAQITDAGLDFLHNLDKIKNAVADRSELKRYMENLDKFYSNKNRLAYYVRKAMESYERVASNLKRKSVAEHEREILEMVRRYQNKQGYGPRTEEINRILEFKLYRYLGNLIRKGKLNKEKRGREVRYTIFN